ncbi:hypothetical protein [Streptomyces sp. NPDC056049]|uniref:hypothetical protein n=1 Tax=Streptomyces sp. NPDC056049 TaxID=3345693 RepID=UPI0035DDFD13
MITLTRSGEETLPALREACLHAGFDPARAQLIRALDNGIWRLPEGVVARVHQAGTTLSAQKEIDGAYWLYGNGVPVSLPRRSEPVVADGRPVTFWTDLGPGGPANPADAARILRALHRLPVPADLRLPSHDRRTRCGRGSYNQTDRLKERRRPAPAGGAGHHGFRGPAQISSVGSQMYGSVGSCSYRSRPICSRK